MGLFTHHTENIQKYIAELVATFALTLGVSLSLLVELPLATPLLAGLIVGVFVYTIGSISGAHINPAVTIALWGIKKIQTSVALMYIVFQIAGALLAMVAANAFTGSTTSLIVENTLTVGLAEALGAFVLVFGISSVVFGKVKDAAAGLVIGGSLIMGILLTGGFSNGVLNPAVAIGIGSVSVMYMIAPIVGAFAAALVYRFISK